jgi:hypothetical protein
MDVVYVLDKKGKFLFFGIIDFFRYVEIHVHLGFLYFVHGLIYILILLILCC